MRLLTSLIITLALAASVAAQTPTPGSDEAKAQARHELNEAARVYREGNFAEAQARSEKALLLDPQNRTAPLFVARTIHAQYKPGDFTPENIAIARAAIVAYQRILERVPNDEESYKAIAFLYGALKEEERLREWLLQRARDGSVPNDKRAEAFVVLASKDWDCSFKITELPTNKIAVLTGREYRASIKYRMPKDRAEFERAKECSNRGLEMANIAVGLTPESETAWSYKTNLLLEMEKLAEMSGDVRQKREFHRQYEEAFKETMRLSRHSQ